MNKIAIILSQNLHWSPYYSRYENLLVENGKNYDLIIWNREGIVEKTEGNLISFNRRDKTNDGSISKVFKFFSYSRFVKKLLKKNRYDKVFFIGTYAFMPAIISGFLKKNYKSKYWIDLRDLTYEKIYLFYKKEGIAINNSFYSVISSKGFLPYLPKYDYGYIHNIDPNMEEIYKVYNKKESKKGVIRISYIGNLSYWNPCKEMIDLFSNNVKFEMRFVGPGYERIKEYCEKNNVKNVWFHGRFERKKTVDFYNETDIVYNIYGNDEINLRTALSNKLYYAMKFRIPILVSPNTYMESICNKYNIGITFENNVDFPEKLYNIYNNFEKEKHDFDGAWNDVFNEDKKCELRIKEFLEKTNE